MNILLKMTGSIACYKACDLISRLVKQGHQVQTVTSAAAEKFIGPATLEGLTGRPNLRDLWKTGDQMAHIRLPEWADVVLLCPATANSINRLANGVGDDLVSTLFLAHDFSTPYLLAPAMNPRMMSHPGTIESLRKLESWGVTVLPTGEGRLACGDFGHGKLLEPEQILEAVLQARHPKAHASLKILVTAGGTEEAVDSVRVLSNLSSGKTGSFLAHAFSRSGAEVTLLRSYRGNPSSHPRISEKTFQSSGDLQHLLQQELGKGDYDWVVHLAAVSDFSIALDTSAALETTRKLSSDKPVRVTLNPAPKLLPHLKEWAGSKKRPRVIGFKLTDTLDLAEAENPALALLQSDAVDVVVHNARDSMNATGDTHPCRIYSGDGRVQEIETKAELASTLWELIGRSDPSLAPSG